jgi:hypothetical protein
MGMRRSRPKALGVTRTPSGLWRRLYSARSTRRTTRETRSGAQFGRGRLVEHALRDDLAGRVTPAAQAVDERLGHILDDGEPPRRVAVEGRITYRQFALVPGRQHEPTKLVGQAHEHNSPQPALDVFFGQAGPGAGKDVLKH